jgi:hypothetical protein
MNTVGKVIVGGLVAGGIYAFLRKAKQAATAKNDIFIEISPNDVSFQKGSLIVDLMVTLENKSALSVTLNDLWTRLQYKNKEGAYVDIGRGTADKPKISLQRGEVNTFVLPLKVSGLGVLSAVLSGATEIKAISSFKTIGAQIQYPTIVDLNVFKTKIRNALGLSGFGQAETLTEIQPNFFALI